jgi:hypothetical protein
VPPYNFIYVTNELNFEESDDNVGVTIAEDIIYEDVPGVLIFCVVNGDGEGLNIEAENTVKFTGDDITVNFSWVLQAIEEFINETQTSSEEEMEFTEDSELEERRVVESGYILHVSILYGCISYGCILYGCIFTGVFLRVYFYGCLLYGCILYGYILYEYIFTGTFCTGAFCTGIFCTTWVSLVNPLIYSAFMPK